MDVEEIIRKAKLPERTGTLYLAGDLVARWEDLDRQRVEAAREDADAMEGGRAVELARQMEALRDEMLASGISWRMRALPRLKYAALLAEHPARRDEQGDWVPTDRLGYNADTYYPAIVRASWVEPVLSVAMLDQLLDETITHRQFDELATAAHLVNRGKVDIPFSLAASASLRSSGSE